MQNLIAKSFSSWVSDTEEAMLSSNVGTGQLPFQSWRPFKEAFAPGIVSRAFQETPRSIEHIVDPFGGSGTTALASQFLGVHPTTVEVNPFLCDLIEAKLAFYEVPDVVRSYAQVRDFVHSSPVCDRPIFPGAPKTFVEPGHNGRYVFSKSVAARILAFRNAIDCIEGSLERRLFRVLLAATVVSVSNIVVSGKGRRYRQNWVTRQSAPADVDKAFSDRVLSAIKDISRYKSRPYQHYTLISGDARTRLDQIEEFDLSVFSPPYPNSFDYTDVYNVELWSMGYLASSVDNRALREATFRSHVQIKRDFSTSDLKSRSLAIALSKLRKARAQLWNKSIPEMVGAYFSDMLTVMSSLTIKLRPEGRIYAVVGDSRYAAVNIPTANILVDISKALDLTLVTQERIRSMRVSPQQGGRQELPESLLVFQKS